MSLTGLLSYLGGALAYAAVAGVVILLAGRLLGWRASRAQAGLVLSTCFVIFLALSPFPDPAALDCSSGGEPALLTPFGFLEPYRRLWQAGRPPLAWLTNLGIVSPIMNVVFFAVVGAFLAGLTRSSLGALAFACTLTVFIEVSQLSALYGLYPCPYRQFDIDDLLLNVAGVMLGFWLWRRGRQVPHKDAGPP